MVRLGSLAARSRGFQIVAPAVAASGLFAAPGAPGRSFFWHAPVALARQRAAPQPGEFRARSSAPGRGEAQAVFVYSSGSAMIPSITKTNGGEDAFFIAEGQGGGGAYGVGVADGVGGWAEVGIDPGIYARALMAEAKAAAGLEDRDDPDPLRVLKTAAAKTEGTLGGSTCCVLLFCRDQLRAANLGDSSFLVIRDGEVVFKSEQQQHSFNFPYQLCGQKKYSDDPDSAEVFELNVEAGDIVVCGTDGLFDNMYTEEILGLVNDSGDSKGSNADLAQAIAEKAIQNAQDKTRVVPWTEEAMKIGYYTGGGGKMDDVTVVVTNIGLAT